jgi:hypothetical protein
VACISMEADSDLAGRSGGRAKGVHGVSNNLA